MNTYLKILTNLYLIKQIIKKCNQGKKINYNKQRAFLVNYYSIFFLSTFSSDFEDSNKIFLF